MQPEGAALADGLRGVGAVDAIDRAGEVHGAGAGGFTGAAGHEAQQVGLTLERLLGRMPIRPLRLLLDGLGAGPGEAFAADADAVAERATIAEHQIEEGVGGIGGRRCLALRASRSGDLALNFDGSSAASGSTSTGA